MAAVYTEERKRKQEWKRECEYPEIMGRGERNRSSGSKATTPGGYGKINIAIGEVQESRPSISVAKTKILDHYGIRDLWRLAVTRRKGLLQSKIQKQRKRSKKPDEVEEVNEFT